MRESTKLLLFRRGITGRVSARDARLDHIRDRDSRATETRVRYVPAVAIRGRCVSVADDTADRPVHARTRSGAARRMRGRRTLSSARGRMIGSRMLSLRMRERTEKQIASPTLQTNRRDSPAAERNELATAAPSIGTRLPARKLVTIVLESTFAGRARTASRRAHDAVHAAYVTIDVSAPHCTPAHRIGPICPHSSERSEALPSFSISAGTTS